jgi:hypothetical protein
LRNSYSVSAHALKVIHSESHSIIDGLAIFRERLTSRDEVGHFALRQTNGVSAVAFQQGFMARTLSISFRARREEHPALAESAQIKYELMVF